MTTNPEYRVGIDVGKPWLDMATWGEGKVLRVTNDDTGVREIIRRRRQVPPERDVRDGEPRRPHRRDGAGHGTPFDAAQAQANAEVVVAMSKLPFVGFVEGTASTEKGKAAAKIWSDRAKFDEASRKMQDEVGKLLVAARSNNLDANKAAFGPVGQSCKGCHDEYRNQQ